MLNNLPSSLKAELYDRISSPLFASFIMSFVVWNYEAIFIMFSSMPMLAKLHHFEYVIYTHILYNIGILFIGPLASSLLFIAYYPKLANRVYKYSQEQKQALIKIKVKIEDETPLTNKESRAIRQSMVDLQTKYYDDLASKDSQLKQIKETSEFKLEALKLSSKNQIHQLKTQLAKLNSDLELEKKAHSQSLDQFSEKIKYMHKATDEYALKKAEKAVQNPS